jgi:RHS repeat-associated protein
LKVVLIFRGIILSQRDNAGTIIQKKETLNAIKATYDYSYDTRGKLTSVSKDNQEVENYTYDDNGNRVEATVYGVTTQANYTLDDNIEVYGDNTYRYDEDGYLVEKTTPQETTTYIYNTLGALTSVTTPTKTISYHLNALNQRVAKEVDGVITEKYLWANLTTLLAIYDKDSNLIQRFNYTDNRMPISMTQDNQIYYLHYDQVGTLRAVSDIDHNIIKEVTYDTFGNILSDTNQNFKVPFGFAGGLHDRDTGLVHFGYREYDPKTGKWTAKDPIGFAGGDSNLYGYVLGDPVNFVDPEGLKIGMSGSGGFGAGVHAGVAGAHYHYSIKTINGKTYKVHTICGRIGLGLYFGAGMEATAGIEDDCQSDGWSGGVGGDVAFATSGAGASLTGNSSGASLSTGFRAPASSLGLGVSVGIDGCYSWVSPL